MLKELFGQSATQDIVFNKNAGKRSKIVALGENAIAIYCVFAKEMPQDVQNLSKTRLIRCNM